MRSSVTLIFWILAALSDVLFAQGPAGNRTIGIVYEKIYDQGGKVTTQPSFRATVSIFNRDKTDETNGDGQYYIIIPGDLPAFSLIAKKSGYQAMQSGNYNNDSDPVEVKRIEMEPIDPKARELRQTVDREVQIYRAVASGRIRELILRDLTDLLGRVSPGDAQFIRERISSLPRQ